MEVLMFGYINIGLIKKINMKTIKYLFILIILNSCGLGSDTNNLDKELPNPETIKGMKLGLDFDSQIEVGNQNGICKNDLPNDHICQYKISETVYARSGLYYSLFNGQKVLAEIKLILNSPFNFPKVINGMANGEDAEYPSLKKAEVDDIISMYKSKYGKGEKYEWEYGGTYDWTQGDLYIRLEYSTTLYSYGYQIHPEIKEFFQNDAYTVEIVYCYVDEIKKMLKNEKSHNGEPIGDKI